MTWGLQYSAFKRLGRLQYNKHLGGPLQQEGRLEKYKADTDNGSRWVRAREGQDNDSVTGSELTSLQDVDDDNQQSPQDVDDQRSQPSRVISVQLWVPAGRKRRYKSLLEWLVVAADREDRRENHRDPPAEDPYGGMELT